MKPDEVDVKRAHGEARPRSVFMRGYLRRGFMVVRRDDGIIYILPIHDAKPAA